MELCSYNHDEICYESGHNIKCPLCEVMEDNKESVASLEDEIVELKDTIETLEESQND